MSEAKFEHEPPLLDAAILRELPVQKILGEILAAGPISLDVSTDSKVMDAAAVIGKLPSRLIVAEPVHFPAAPHARYMVRRTLLN